MKLTLSTNFPEIDRALARLPSEVADKASVSTLNKVTAQANTQMVREIGGTYNLTRKKIVEKLHIKKARFTRGALLIEAALESYGPSGRRAINVINFQARETKAGLTAKIKKGGSRSLISKKGFIANAGRTAFTRVGETRLPIKPLQTIDVPQMFNAKPLNKRVVRFIEQKLPQVFENEAVFYLSKWGTR